MTIHTPHQIQNIESHWTDYFKIIHKLNLEKIKSSEIGSNDGYLLNKFYKKDFKVVGVDSSLLMTKISRKKLINHLIVFLI